ncbi:hypothetical protein ACIQWL_39215, partial [Streptomyces mirabilis]
PGSTALDGAGGTPMMPMMPMGGMGGMGAGGGAGGQEGAPSDASGLLGGHVTPWAGSSDLGGDTPGEVTGGVGAGGPGLHLPGGEDLVAPGLPGGSADVAGFPSTGVGDGLPGLSDMPTEARVPGEGVSAFPGSTALDGAGGTPMMPMMPMGGMGGMGAGGGAGGQEGARSDASGLLGGDTGPWAHTADAGESTGDVFGGAQAGGPGLDLPGDGGEHLVAGGPSPQAAESAGGTPMMPMMPMGGMGAGAAGGEREQERSDASGLLFTTGEPWADTPATDEPVIGAPDGTSSGDAYLRHGDGVGQPAATSAWPPSVEEPGQEQPHASQAEQPAAGFPAVMPFLGPGASEGGTGTSRSGERGERAGRSEGTPAAQWGDPEWLAGQPGASGAEPSHGLSQSAWDVPQSAATAQPSAGAAATAQPSAGAAATAQPPAAAGPAGVHSAAEAAPPAHGVQLPAHTEVVAPVPQAATAYQAPAAGAVEPQARGEQQTARQESVQQVSATEAPAADDPTTWDVSTGSLFPLLGGHGQETDTGTEAARQEAATATSVMAGAYAIGRAVTADQASAEPARPAWRPKASGGMAAELSCAIDEPQEPPAEAARRRRSATDETDADAEAGKDKDKKRDRDGKTSVADLLRQEEDVWGGAGQGSGVFG